MKTKPLSCRLLTLLLAASLAPACGEAPPSSSGGSTAVTILVEPSDGGSALLAAISGAQKSVHMTMYLLSSGAIRDALIARHRAGVEVKIVLNQQFPPGTTVTNQSSYTALQAAGVPVVWAPATFTYTHEKCLVIDGTAAWIMTMNASTSGLTNNREYLAIDTTPADVAEAEAQFADDYAGTPHTPTGNLLMSPVTARPGILGLINSARVTVDFEAEEVGDTQITAALCSAQARGAKTRGVLADNTLSSTQQRAVDQLKACGAAVYKLAKPYIHAKAIAVDNQAVYVGSINFTVTSLDQNRELGLTTTTAAAVAPVAQTIAADIAAGTPL
jgi:phosphatidylserine/phosphatidylglycerophosphate/cardiolipin synthase-like enzyme